MPANAIPFISVHDAAARWNERPEGLVLLDVREPFEWQLASIDGTTNIPLRSVPEHLEELAGAREVLCLCHHGMRSHAAAAWLIEHGVNAINIQGGIDAWSMRVAPDVPRY